MGDERVVISVNKHFFFTFFFTLKLKDKYDKLLTCKTMSALGVYIVPNSE